MARGATLLELLDDLRAECRLSLNPAHNAQTRETHVKQLQRMQRWLWKDYAWPHLRVERTIKAQAGQRFYTPPADVGIERISHMEVRYGDRWVPLAPGIGLRELEAYDSDSDERATPTERWRIFEGDRIEVWPIPADDTDATTNEGLFKVVGIRDLKPLRDDADRCDLDSDLIVLFAAAEILGAAGAKDAGLKLEQARGRLQNLRADLTPRRQISLVGREPEGRRPRGMPRVDYRIQQPSDVGPVSVTVNIDGGREG